MKIDKEYPATHSMMTSWFAIDAEGNVAIVEFGDDGPVPDFVGYKENSPSEVMFETLADDENDNIPYLPLTDEQINMMLSYSKPKREMPYSYSAWYEIQKEGNVVENVDVDLDENPKYSALIDYLEENEQMVFPIKIDANYPNCKLKTWLASLIAKADKNKITIDRYCFTDGIIEIDAAYEKEVIRIMCEHKYEFCLLSPQRHLYYSTCNMSDFPSIRRHVKMFYDFYVGGEKEMNFTPFFYYKQEWLHFPADRQTAPIHPFKSSQLPRAIADKAIKLPIKFSDSKFFQFVKYYGFETWGSNWSFHTTDDRQYFPMKDENNVMLLYGTKHEKPIEPSEVEKMLECGDIDWERITNNYYKLDVSKETISYKPFHGDNVTADVVWKEMQEVFNQIANAPLED